MFLSSKAILAAMDPRKTGFTQQAKEVKQRFKNLRIFVLSCCVISCTLGVSKVEYTMNGMEIIEAYTRYHDSKVQKTLQLFKVHSSSVHFSSFCLMSSDTEEHN